VTFRRPGRRSAQPVAWRGRPALASVYNLAGAIEAGSRRVDVVLPRC
jgi:hypothetical protein